MSKRVFIVRHGETDYNIARRWQGHLDTPLNENGRAQAQALATYLQDEPIDIIYSSNLSRAYDTATAIANLKNMPVISDERLREFTIGVFAGKTRDELEAEMPDVLQQWNNDDNYPLPEGESRIATQKRVVDFWKTIIDSHDAETILFVSHGGTLRMLFRALIDDAQEFHFGNTSLSILEQVDGAWHVKALNTSPHLEDDVPLK